MSPRLEDAVRAADGRWLGIRCARCGAVFAGRGRAQAHADHSWECAAGDMEAGLAAAESAALDRAGL